MGKKSRRRRERQMENAVEATQSDVIQLLFYSLAGLRDHVNESDLSEEELQNCALAADLCGMIVGTSAVGVLREGVDDEDFAPLATIPFLIISEIESDDEHPLKSTMNALPFIYESVDRYIGGEFGAKIKEAIATATDDRIGFTRVLIRTLRTLYETIVWDNCRGLDGESLSKNAE